MATSCAVIIPVFNEERAIADTVLRLQAICSRIEGYAFEIICINDGSSDGTGKVLAALPAVTVLTHRANRGYGAALRTGLDFCTQEWVFIADADGTYPLEDLERLLQCAEGGIDMVVGSRGGAGISRSPVRQLARWVLRKMVHGLTGMMVPDLNSGMRVFRRSLYVEFRHLLPLGFSFTTTLTVASLYSGRRVEYVPIHYDRRIGRSNIKPVKDFLGFTMLIVRLASYFEPLRFFLPAALVLLAVGIARAIRDVIVVNQFGALSVILLLTALQIFAFGVIADVIVRRFQVVPHTPQRPQADKISTDVIVSEATKPSAGPRVDEVPAAQRAGGRVGDVTRMPST